MSPPPRDTGEHDLPWWYHDHEKRLRKLERWIFVAIGVCGTLSFLGSYLAKYLPTP